VEKTPSLCDKSLPPFSMCSVPTAVLPSIDSQTNKQNYEDSIRQGDPWTNHTRLGLPPVRTADDCDVGQLSRVEGGLVPPPPSSYVHADETSVGFDRPTLDLPGTTTNGNRCVQFRHSGWQPRRAKIRRALIINGTAGRPLERFDHCGESAWIMRAVDVDNVYALRSSTCKNRWCEPCSQEKRRIIQSNVATRLKGRHLRFLTLTLKAVEDSLSNQLDRIVLCFRKLRQHKEIKPAMTGGVFFFEVTYNVEKHLWHPHLHILFEGSYIDHAVLKRLWLSVTGDSYIVDIRAIRDSTTAASYIAKYAAKSVDSHVVAHEPALNECIRSFNGRRTFNVFGDWRGLDLSKNPETQFEWVPVAPLVEILDRAAQGEPWARSILALLRGGSIHVSDHPVDSS